MTDRITLKDLQYFCDVINERTGNNKKPYNEVNGKFSANIGNYHLDGAYGGYKLVQIVSDGGGIRDISRDGFGTKRQLHSFMRAYLAGLAVATEQKAG